VRKNALTGAGMERGALYRTLRRLEVNGNVGSDWETDKAGPARRVHQLTAEGERHLEAWATVLDHVSKSVVRFVKETGGTLQQSGAVRTRPSGSIRELWRSWRMRCTTSLMPVRLAFANISRARRSTSRPLVAARTAPPSTHPQPFAVR